MHSIPSKSRNVSECLLHTKRSQGPVLSGPWLVPKPLQGNPGRVPAGILTPTFLCTLHPHLQTRLRPSLLLFWCSPFQQLLALPSTLNPLLLCAWRTRGSQRPGEGPPTPHLHLWPSKAAKRPEPHNLFPSNQETPILPMCCPHPLQGPFFCLLSFCPKDCPCSSAVHFLTLSPAVIFSPLLLLPLLGSPSFHPLLSSVLILMPRLFSPGGPTEELLGRLRRATFPALSAHQPPGGDSMPLPLLHGLPEKLLLYP